MPHTIPFSVSFRKHVPFFAAWSSLRKKSNTIIYDDFDLTQKPFNALFFFYQKFKILCFHEFLRRFLNSKCLLLVNDKKSKKYS